jgi:hypothetical protein
MGLVIFGLISIALFGLLMWGFIELGAKNQKLEYFYFGATCVSFVFLVVSTGMFSIFGLDVFNSYIKKDLHLQEYKNERYSIVRMLQEDYNSQNLSNAIEFNNKQKMIVAENNSFLFKYTTSYYSVDTIQIPEKKFMPTSKVIVEGLEMDTE